MLRQILEEKFLDKEIEIYLNGHTFYFPKNSNYFDGIRESKQWDISPVAEIDNSNFPDEDGSWSKFRTIKSKMVKVIGVIHKVDYESDEWFLECIGKKGKEYLISIPE